MTETEDLRKGSPTVVRIGLTLSVKLLQKIKRLYLAASEVLFPYEISFTDFTNLVLKATTYGIFREVPKETEEETTFYSLRISSQLKDETLESLKDDTDKIWKEMPPIDYNQFVKNQFLSITTLEGSYSMLAYVWYLKLILDLLEKLGIDQGTVLKKGSLPDIPQLYGPLNNVLGEYLTAEITTLRGRELSKGKLDLRERVLRELTETINKLRENSKAAYDLSDVIEVIKKDIKLVGIFPALLGTPDTLGEMNMAIIFPEKKFKKQWENVLVNSYHITFSSLVEIGLNLK